MKPWTPHFINHAKAKSLIASLVYNKNKFKKLRAEINRTRQIELSGSAMKPNQRFILLLSHALILTLSQLVFQSESAREAFRREPGHPLWHHGAFLDVRDSVRSDVRHMLHSRAEVSSTAFYNCNFLFLFFFLTLPFI